MEFRHYNIAQKLIENGYNVCIITSAFSHLLHKPPILKYNHLIETIDGITYCWIKTPKYQGNSLGRVINMLVFSLKLLKIQNRVSLNRPDYVIASSPHIFVAWNGRKAAEYFNAKFIFEVRDIWPLTIMELKRINKFHPFIVLMDAVENYAYRHADLVISPLPNLKTHLLNKGFGNIKIETIPNGILMEDFKCLNDFGNGIREGLKKLIDKNSFIVCFAGTLSKSNSVDLLIGAAKMLQDYDIIQFLIIGDGEEKKRLLNEVRNCNLKNVTFLDRMNRAELLRHLRQCDVFYNGAPRSILYSYGISSIKIAEYMFLGKPIIDATEAYNNPVSEANCGIVIQPEDSELLGKAIMKVFSMTREERIVMGERGKAYAINNLSYEKIVDRLIAAIENI